MKMREGGRVHRRVVESEEAIDGLGCASDECRIRRGSGRYS
jgi:hypothetical protein